MTKKIGSFDPTVKIPLPESSALPPGTAEPPKLAESSAFDEAKPAVPAPVGPRVEEQIVPKATMEVRDTATQMLGGFPLAELQQHVTDAYLTTDRNAFSTLPEARQHQRSIDDATQLLAYFAVPRDANKPFADVTNYIQYSPEDVRRMTALARNHIATYHNRAPSPGSYMAQKPGPSNLELFDTKGPAALKGRLGDGAISDVLHRLSCIDDKGREWSIPELTKTPLPPEVAHLLNPGTKGLDFSVAIPSGQLKTVFKTSDNSISLDRENALVNQAIIFGTAEVKRLLPESRDDAYVKGAGYFQLSENTATQVKKITAQLVEAHAVTVGAEDQKKLQTLFDRKISGIGNYVSDELGSLIKSAWSIDSQNRLWFHPNFATNPPANAVALYPSKTVQY